jgi:hypothetical protein
MMNGVKKECRCRVFPDKKANFFSACIWLLHSMFFHLLVALKYHDEIARRKRLCCNAMSFIHTAWQSKSIIYESEYFS